ncbi:MAG TPA: S41 family peptidase [Pseudomonadales bacterium]
MTSNFPTTVTRRLASLLALAAIFAVLGGCGGGGGGSSPAVAVAPEPEPEPEQWQPGVFEPASNFKDMCASPRIGAQFPDTQGTTTDENNWLRSWSNDLYLWYEEIEDRDPARYTTPDYFDLLKTFASTPTGAPKDRFHFTYPTQEWEALSQSGQQPGYGAAFVLLAAAPPRELAVAYIEPASPAEAAGLVRGARVLEIDGVSVVNGSDVDTLNAGLYPSAAGEEHVFVVQEPGGGSRTVTLTSAIVTEDPVQFVKVIDSLTGPVGYLHFTRHIATAERELIDAIEFLGNAGVTDLILDVRYNGGGFLDIANELAFMIAGGGAASGRVFAEIQFNDKHQTVNPVTGAVLEPEYFHTTTQGFSAEAGDPLPTLNLDRLYVLTTADTCSASESIVNGLRGIDLDVVQVGSPTCGKPYGFYATDNCGTTYFSIQFKAVNAKGFGDYPDGFAPEDGAPAGAVTLPGCGVDDDFDNPLGDPAEALLATALEHRAGLGCPVGTATAARAEPRLAGKGSGGEPLAPPRPYGMVLVR